MGFAFVYEIGCAENEDGAGPAPNDPGRGGIHVGTYTIMLSALAIQQGDLHNLAFNGREDGIKQLGSFRWTPHIGGATDEQNAMRL